MSFLFMFFHAAHQLICPYNKKGFDLDDTQIWFICSNICGHFRFLFGYLLHYFGY